MRVVTELKLYSKHQLVGYDHYDSLGCDWGCVFKWEVGIVICLSGKRGDQVYLYMFISWRKDDKL